MGSKTVEVISSEQIPADEFYEWLRPLGVVDNRLMPDRIYDFSVHVMHPGEERQDHVWFDAPRPSSGPEHGGPKAVERYTQLLGAPPRSWISIIYGKTPGSTHLAMQIVLRVGEQWNSVVDNDHGSVFTIPELRAHYETSPDTGFTEPNVVPQEFGPPLDYSTWLRQQEEREAAARRASKQSPPEHERMVAARRIYVSLAPEDMADCAPVLAALDAWGLEYVAPALSADDLLPDELSRCAVLLRLLTPHAAASPRMREELAAFVRSQREPGADGGSEYRYLLQIQLVPEPPVEYPPFPFIIHAAGLQPWEPWQDQLAAALGVTVARKLAHVAETGDHAVPAGGTERDRTTGDSSPTAELGGVAAEDEDGDEAGDVGGDEPPVTLTVQMVHRPLSQRDATVRRVVPRWQVHAGDQRAPDMLLAQGVLYATSDTGVLALDPRTGEVHWRDLELGATGVNPVPAPAYANGTLFVAAQGWLHAMRASDGAPLWVAKVGEPTSSTPAYAEGAVYVTSDDGEVYTVEAATGSERWQTRITPARFGSAPVPAGELVHVGAMDSHVYALSARDGSVVWRQLVGGHSYVPPVVLDSVVYCSGYGGPLFALDAGSGDVLWQLDTWYGGSELAVAGDVVYGVSTYDGTLHAVRASDAAILWSTKLEGAVSRAPTVAGERLYIHSGRAMQALDRASGTVLWSSSRIGNMNSTGPLLMDDLLIVGLDSGTLLAVAIAELEDDAHSSTV